MIPARTATLAAYARAVKAGDPDGVAAALALDTAARLRELIGEGLARSPIAPDHARELAELILAGGEHR